MKSLLINIIIYLLPAALFSQTLIEGTYTGLEKICWSTSRQGKCINYDVKNPDRKWYYENLFTFKGDSVFLTRHTISISATDTSRGTTTQPMYRAGIVKRQKNKIEIDLQEGKANKHYKGFLTTEGIIIQQYLYKKKRSYS